MLLPMKPVMFAPLLLVAACSSGPTKEESLKIFTATNSTMLSAQTAAVHAARVTSLAPASLTLAYSGACLGGGSIAVNGSYEGSGSDDKAAFDLTVQLTNCNTLTSTVDGELHWTSTVDGTSFAATMTGGVSYKDPNTAASCDYDLALTVNPSLVSYGGTLCGYDVKTELILGH